MAVLVYRDNISRMSYCITIIGKEQDPVWDLQSLDLNAAIKHSQLLDQIVHVLRWWLH